MQRIANRHYQQPDWTEQLAASLPRLHPKARRAQVNSKVASLNAALHSCEVTVRFGKRLGSAWLGSSASRLVSPNPTLPCPPCPTRQPCQALQEGVTAAPYVQWR